VDFLAAVVAVVFRAGFLGLVFGGAGGGSTFGGGTCSCSGTSVSGISSGSTTATVGAVAFCGTCAFFFSQPNPANKKARVKAKTNLRDFIIEFSGTHQLGWGQVARGAVPVFPMINIRAPACEPLPSVRLPLWSRCSHNCIGFIGLSRYRRKHEAKYGSRARLRIKAQRASVKLHDPVADRQPDS